MGETTGTIPNGKAGPFPGGATERAHVKRDKVARGERQESGHSWGLPKERLDWILKENWDIRRKCAFNGSDGLLHTCVTNTNTVGILGREAREAKGVLWAT